MVRVLVISQLAGFTVALAVVLVSHRAPPAAHYLIIAAAGGVAGLVGLGAFYHALAVGTMSIVAPISATGAAVPVIVGLATGEHPGTVRLVGILTAVAGVVLASREAGPGEAEVGATGPGEAEVGATRDRSRHQVPLALAAALGFGAFFVAMDRAAHGDVLWALLAARGADVPLLVGLALLTGTAISGRPRALVPLIAVGLLDVGANALYAWATTLGLLSVVAVLGSLYPVATVLLARGVLGERVRRVQELGIATVLAGVALIAAG
ncbi:MAG: EamA/RhaT family transporter [Solirubrobacterales bacterium]|nr:MAG: EamA/RhaT family transporter [Solirubrobacterales bacterium]